MWPTIVDAHFLVSVLVQAKSVMLSDLNELIAGKGYRKIPGLAQWILDRYVELGTDMPLGDSDFWSYLMPDSQPHSQPESQPHSQPDSQPSSQPDSQPPPAKKCRLVDYSDSEDSSMDEDGEPELGVSEQDSQQPGPSNQLGGRAQPFDVQYTGQREAGRHNTLKQTFKLAFYPDRTDNAHQMLLDGFAQLISQAFTHGEQQVCIFGALCMM